MLRKNVFVVAEIGLNHNGDMDLAKKSIAAAADSGADSVKFQNYITEDFISDKKIKYKYLSNGKEIEESMFDMFKRCELDNNQLKDLKSYADSLKLDFHLKINLDILWHLYLVRNYLDYFLISSK